MHGEVLYEIYPKISIVLIRSSELIHFYRKLPFVMPTAFVKQIAKVHGLTQLLHNI